MATRTNAAIMVLSTSRILPVKNSSRVRVSRPQERQIVKTNATATATPSRTRRVAGKRRLFAMTSWDHRVWSKGRIRESIVTLMYEIGDPAALTGKDTITQARFEHLDWPPALTPRLIENCEFDTVSFKESDLEGIEMKDCRFSACTFSRAILMDASFERCSFFTPSDGSAEELRCRFAHCDLRRTQWTGCDLSLCEFPGCQLHGVRMERCQAQGADFAGADFSWQVSRKMVLSDVQILDTNLAYANLTGAYLAQASLRGSRLSHADLSHACLEGADLRDCELHQVIFTLAVLRNADLRDAQLDAIDPRTADLVGVKLKEWQLKALAIPLGIEIEP